MVAMLVESIILMNPEIVFESMSEMSLPSAINITFNCSYLVADSEYYYIKYK